VIWLAVTDVEAMRGWFPTRIELDEWKVGATITHHFDGHDLEPLSGTVLAWDPPRRVSFTWGDDTISLTLDELEGGGTLFVLTEELSAAHAARNAAGWAERLDLLEFGVNQTPWRERFEGYVEAFEPILGPQEGPPDGITLD
jgi:uncharacterized protein YndB with AHSA1/START domain